MSLAPEFGDFADDPGDAGQAGQPDKAEETRTVKPESRPDGRTDETRTTSSTPALATEPNILDLFAADLRLAGVAGEQRFAKLTYLSLTSRLLEWGKPTSRPVSLIGKGTSSTGKSHTQRTVLRFFPESAYFDMGSMSKRYLLYSEEPLSHRFLVIPEWAVIANDEELVATLRILLSEGRLVHGTVSADGKPKAHRIEKPGPTGLLMTTTAAAVDSELETRCLADFTDDTPEQTRRVFEVLAELEENDEDLVDWARWHDLQEWLAADGEWRVHIPFAAALAQSFPIVATRLRRDFVSTLCLVRAHAILHQGTRERDPRGRIVATIDDYERVRDLVGALIAEAADAGVSPAMRETVETVRALLEGREHVSMKAITDALSVGRSAAYDRVNRALFRGYLANVASKNEQARKIAIGGALPGEELFLPSGEDLVRLSSGTPTGQDFGSTIVDSDGSSGSPGCPADPLDEVDDDEIERLEHLVLGTLAEAFGPDGEASEPVVFEGAPTAGAPGFLEFLDRALAGGLITDRERRERRLVHFRIRGAEAA